MEGRINRPMSVLATGIKLRSESERLVEYESKELWLVANVEYPFLLLCAWRVETVHNLTQIKEQWLHYFCPRPSGTTR
jgi:hypothetical protein